MSERITDALMKEARWQAQKLDREAKGNEDELATIRARLTEYKAKHRNDYLCPCCWMRSEQWSPLDPLPAGKDDVLICDVCGSDFLIER